MKYIHHFLLIVLCFVASLAAKAQEQPEIVYTSDHPKYVLGGITVDGIKGYDDDLLINISNLVVGETYEVPGPDISDAIKSYWKQGLFSHVSIEADSIVRGKIYLHVKLAAQPRISTLSINGVKKSEREEIEKSIPLKAGNQITPNLVARTKKRIKNYFDDKGYKDADIQIVQKEDITADNRMIVDINIDKNNKIRVHKIYITGVEPKEVKPLKQAMKKTNDRSSIKKWFSSKKYLEEKYQEDKGFVIDKLNSWGLRDALIVADSVVKYDDKHVDVYLDIHKGQKYYVRDISWVGNTVYTTEALDKTLTMKRGDVYDQKLMRKRLSEDDDAIGQQYYNNGYVFYNLDPVEINVEGDSIDLEMRITEGQQATFNRIRITGNDRVYEYVIRRELRTKPGDLFNMEAIKRSIRELSNMNQFDPEALSAAMNGAISPDPRTGTVDVTYPLTSKGGDQIELSAGWGQTGIIGKIGLKFTNFSMQNLFGRGATRRAGFIPQGDGQTLSIQGQTNGTYYQSYSLSFVDPWFGKKRPNQFSVGVYYSKQSDINSNFYSSSIYNNLNNLYGYGYGYGGYGYGYGGYGNSYYNYSNYYDPDKWVQMLGASIGFGKRLRWPDDYFGMSVSLGYTRYMLKNWQYFGLLTDGNCNNINLTFALNRTSIDNSFYPRSGSDFNFSLTITPPYSLWDGINYEGLANNYESGNYQKEAQQKYRWVEYHKWRFSFKNYTALANSIKHTPVLYARAEVGILGHYNKYKKSPFETYYVGGDGMSGYSTGYATETIGLRGYDNGSLAGYNTPNAYAYERLTLELRYPIMLETSTSIYALAFAEAGNAWQNVSQFNPFDLKKSAGVGVRILLPMVGLMGIDWAYGFQKYNSSGTKIGGSQFHFIIGQEF